MNCNAKALSEAPNKDMDVIKENVQTLHEQTGTVLSDIDDGENETIRFCKLVTDRPALTFGTFNILSSFDIMKSICLLWVKTELKTILREFF